MFQIEMAENLPRAELYELLRKQARALVAEEPDFIANAANLCALLWHSLPQINWVGLYRLKVNELVLGPFQGKPACVRIPLGRGVCGTAAAEKRSILVPDVQKFPGHIACDSESKSELVVPLRVCDDIILGVLDIDSPIENRFDDEDLRQIEQIAEILTYHVTRLMKTEL
jgi:L-methionine (R)-S-oxide reductase